MGGEYLVKNAIGYVRVSTEEQSLDDKYGIETQKEAILSYAHGNGYEIVHWCIDVTSGVKDNRDELDKILYKYHELPVHEAVIVFKNDRIARDTKLYFYYFYTLEKRNIELLSSEEHFSEGDDFANIYRSLLMFVAEQERRNIALRTGKGRSIKAKCGGYSGGNKPYGYKVVDGALVIDRDEEIVVRLIFSEIEKGLTFTEICNKLSTLGYVSRKGNRFQISTIRSIVANRKLYEGNYKYGDMDWVRGVHEPILSDRIS